MSATAAVIALFSLLTLAGAAPASDKPLTVAVSIPPQAYLLKRVGGDLVQPLVMLPPGRSPATYEPTPRQLAALDQTQVYFLIGVPFEKVLVPKLKSTYPKLRLVDTRRGIRLLALPEHHHDHEEGGDHKGHHHHGGPDPHVWMSPVLAQTIAANMVRILVQIDPAHASQYRTNLEALKVRLQSLDRRIAKMLAPFHGQNILVFHPAYGYFCHTYHLRQVAVESGGKEPGPKQLAHIIEEAKEEKARVIFVQPQFSQASARAIAQAIGGSVVEMDPLARDYEKNLLHMAGVIAEALR